MKVLDNMKVIVWNMKVVYSGEWLMPMERNFKVGENNTI